MIALKSAPPLGSHVSASSHLHFASKFSCSTRKGPGNSLNGTSRAAVLSSAASDDPIATDDASQASRRVAFQGFPGAYSEMAANQACPTLIPLPCEQFENAFETLSQWVADRAVLPVENSLGGSIHAVYDLLQRYRLHIVGETFVPVNHCLLALPGVSKADIKTVLSHPQALAQTQEYTRHVLDFRSGLTLPTPSRYAMRILTLKLTCAPHSYVRQAYGGHSAGV